MWRPTRRPRRARHRGRRHGARRGRGPARSVLPPRPGAGRWPRCGSRTSAGRAPGPRRHRGACRATPCPRGRRRRRRSCASSATCCAPRRRRRSRAWRRSCPSRRRGRPVQRRSGATAWPRRAGRAATARTASGSCGGWAMAGGRGGRGCRVRSRVARQGGTAFEREAPDRIPHRRATYPVTGCVRVPSGCGRGACAPEGRGPDPKRNDVVRCVRSARPWRRRRPPGASIHSPRGALGWRGSGLSLLSLPRTRRSLRPDRGRVLSELAPGAYSNTIGNLSRSPISSATGVVGQTSTVFHCESPES